MSATENRLGMDGWWANLMAEVAQMIADAEDRGRAEGPRLSADDIAALQDVRHHLKHMRTFLMVETPDALGTRRANDSALAKVSDVLRRAEEVAA